MAASAKGELKIYIPQDQLAQQSDVRTASGNRKSVTTVTLRVQYRLNSPKAGMRFNGVESNARSKNKFQVITVTNTRLSGFSSADGARCWLPCLDGEEDRFAFDLTVTVPEGPVVIASGESTACQKSYVHPDGSLFHSKVSTFHFTQTFPVHPNMIGMAIGFFHVHVDTTASRLFSGILSSASKDEIPKFHIENSSSAEDAGGSIRHLSVPSLENNPVNERWKRNCDIFTIDVSSDDNSVRAECCDTNLLSLIHTTKGFAEIVKFAQIFFDQAMPWKSYQQVFVDNAEGVFASFAGLCIADKMLLSEPSVLDHSLEVHVMQVQAFLRSWIVTVGGCPTIPNMWVLEGLVGYVCGQYMISQGKETKDAMQKLRVGDFHLWKFKHMEKPIECELQRLIDLTEGYTDCPPLSPHAFDNLGFLHPLHQEIFRYKSVAVFFLIECRIERKMLKSGIKKFMAHSRQMVDSLVHDFQLCGEKRVKLDGGNDVDMKAALHPYTLLHAERLFELLRTVTQGANGEKLSQQFIDEYIHGAGIHMVKVNFHYARKTNGVTLEFDQAIDPLPGISTLVGNLQLKIQEEEKSGNRTERQTSVNETSVNINSPYRFICATKVRKTRNNNATKIVGVEGDDAAETLKSEDTMLKNDTPISWILVDPNRYYLRIIDMEYKIQDLQSENMWYEQLKLHDDQGELKIDDVNSDTKIEAIRALIEIQPSTDTLHKSLVVNILKKCLYNVNVDRNGVNAQCHPDVSAQAAYALAKWQRRYYTSKAATSALMQTFKDLFHDSVDNSLLPNQFGVNQSRYKLKKSLQTAVGLIRKPDESDAFMITPSEVLDFLKGLLDGNDNSQNKYDDCFYVGGILMSYARAVNLTENGSNKDYEIILMHLHRYLESDNIDRFKSFRSIMTSCCLEGLCELYLKHLELAKSSGGLKFIEKINVDFRKYCALHYAEGVRLTAIQCILRAHLGQYEACVSSKKVGENHELEKDRTCQDFGLPQAVEEILEIACEEQNSFVRKLTFRILYDELRGMGRSVLQMLPYSSFGEECSDRNRDAKHSLSANVAQFKAYEKRVNQKDNTNGKEAIEKGCPPVFREDFQSVRKLASKLWSIINGEHEGVLYDLECRSIALWIYKYMWGANGLPRTWKSTSKSTLFSFSSGMKRHQDQISSIMLEIQQFNNLLKMDKPVATDSDYV